MQPTPPQTPAAAPARRFRLSWLIPVLLAAALLILAFSGANWGEMWQTVREGDARYLLLAVGVVTVSNFLRALRWHTLVSSEKPVHPVTVFWITNIGYLGNNFLPARAGDLLRSTWMGQRAGISKSFVLATTFTERIVDVGALVLISVVSLYLVPPDDTAEWIAGATRTMAIIGAVGLAIVFLAPHFEAFILRVVAGLPLPEKVRHVLAGLAQQFLWGMKSLQRPARMARFALLTAGLWASDGVAAICVSHAFGLGLGFWTALLLLAAIGLGSALPSTPGYVGIYQFVSVTVLGMFGFTKDAALVLILAYQGMVYVSLLIFGLTGLVALTRTPGTAHSSK